MKESGKDFNWIDIWLKAFPQLGKSISNFILELTSASSAGEALKMTLSSLWSVIAAHPFIAVAAAVGVAIVAFCKLHESAKEATEKMEKTFSDFEEATDKVQSLNKELETTKDRIDELNAKDNLTFVEESELQKLRESVELLQIQADLAENEAQKKAKDAAKDTINAYRKNFKNDISADAVNDYISWSSSTGNNAGLFYDKSDISAMLAGIQQMKQLRDEAQKGSDDYIHFQNVIDETSDVIWEQVGILTTYKNNLEAIPYDELTEDQLAALDEINAAIKLVYMILDPAKWKNIQWNSIINDKTYDADIKALKSLAAEAEITADTIRKQFPALAQACEDAGLEIADVVNNINASFDHTDGENLSDTIDGIAQSTNKLSDTVLKLGPASSNVKKLSSALGDFRDEGFVTSDTLSDLIDTFGKLDSFDDFIRVMGDSSSTMAEAQKACNQLAEEYINSIGILDDLNESNAGVIETMLTEMGVTNAHEVVQGRLNALKLEAILIAKDQADAEWNVAEQLLLETGASESAIESLKRLRQEQYNAKLAATDLSKASADTISSLLTQAQAAGIAAESIAALSSASALQKRYESGKASFYEVNHYEELMSGYARKAKADLSNLGGSISVPQVKVSLPKGSSSSSSKKEIEKYTATIDKYREAVERLNRVQSERENLEANLSNTNDLRTQIELQQELIGIYKKEQDALHELNEQRDQTIKTETESLKKLGFDVEYDPDNNLFFVKNLEHLNDLVASSKGKYDSVKEATNALRQDTENLINTLGDLNEANQQNSESWRDLAQAAHEARIAIYENTIKEHENSITIGKHWLDDSIKNSDFGGITRYTSEIIDHYRAMQETLLKEADEYRDQDYSETSEQLTKLKQLWWDYYDEIANASANAWQQVVDNANDAVDEIQGLYDTLKDAAQEYADSGFITVDTLQEICSWGIQYLAYLKDENGQLVINEESIQNLIAARTEQMAIETALSYVAQIRSAIERNEINELMNLTLATQTATSATWDLVYAQINAMQMAGQISAAQANAYISNINNMRALADTAKSGIGKVTGEISRANAEAKKALSEQADALDDLLKYVEAMIKQEVKNQVKALEDQVDAMKELVDLQKESLKLEKEKDKYSKTVAEKIKELSKLQQQLALLELDDSREAQAEKTKLLEKMADLQEDLSEKQADKAYDAVSDALDDMYDAYKKEKKKEIDILENSISSEEKVYRLAIERIQTHWGTLYQELLEEQTTPFVQKCA